MSTEAKEITVVHMRQNKQAKKKKAFSKNNNWESQKNAERKISSS